MADPKIKVRLPSDPKDADYEDFVTAYLIAYGYYTESRLILKEGGIDVLELDVLTTPSGDAYTHRKLVEVKSGGEAGFKELFKVFGWVKYLELEAGILIRKVPLEAVKVPLYEKFHKETNVSCKHLNPAAIPDEPIVVAATNLPEKNRRQLLTDAWYSSTAQRIALSVYVAYYKSSPPSKFTEGAKAYRNAVERSFFEKHPADRVIALYKAYTEHPRISGEAVEELAAAKKVDPSEIWNVVGGTSNRLWLQHIMALEHQARIAIIKSALDYIYSPDYESPSKVKNVSKMKIRDLLLPENFKQGLMQLENHPSKNKIPFLLHLFVNVFGGFYFAEDLPLISQYSGVPEKEIEAALRIYDLFFPIQKGWFYDYKGLVQMKMIPAFLRGVGAMTRKRHYEIEQYYNKYDQSFFYIIVPWHNSLIEVLAKEFKVKDEDTPKAKPTEKVGS